MDNNFEKAAEEATGFQKIWLETMSKMMQAACTFSPNSPPPEVLRQIRSGIFQALAQSWDEFMRSPQFLEGMKQWMENAITFRKMTNEFMGRVRNEMQSPSKGDIDSVMLTVRHMEKRLLDRIEELSAEVRELKPGTAGARRRAGAAPAAAAAKRNPARRPAQAARANGKGESQ
ncbi:MAG TPA: hypothetical protein VN578_10245 [Candidatus Binatia bacterium]|jgi:hypothetical protein|nr:hypothetical protein [Candidatus Binatia bacterium]